MNHKRRRPKHRRAGCLFFKPHKDERVAKTARPGTSAARTMQEAVEDTRDRDTVHDAEIDLAVAEGRAA